MLSFPVPPPLKLPVKDLIGDGQNNMNHIEYTLDNPHPGFGKDPNIINYLGHTKYPCYATKPDGEKVIVNNTEEEAAVLGHETKAEAAQGWKEPILKNDGPTIKEYVAAGYKAKNYPPHGYASKSTQEEIDIAIKAETEAEAKGSSGWGT
jgi:hypothetical protein